MMDIDGNILTLEYIDKILIDKDNPNAMLSSLNVVLADNIWHNSKTDYSQGEACVISTIVETTPLINQQLEIPDWYSVPPGSFEFDVWDLIIYDTNALDYQVLSNFKMSCFSVSSIFSSTHKDPFVQDNYIIDISITATRGRAKGIDPMHLSKNRSINLEALKQPIEITTQLKQQEADGGLSQNFSTNNQMIQYKYINSHFFTDKFFVKGTAKSTRCHNCVQLFVSDKGFIYVVPMT